MSFHPPTQKEVKKILCEYITKKELPEKQYIELLKYLIYETSNPDYSELKRQILSLLSEKDALLRNKFYSILNKTKNETLYRNRNFQYLFTEIVVPNFNKLLSNGGSRQKEEITGTKQYTYITASMGSFVSQVLENKKYLKGEKFIDIGCGIGDKVFMINFLSNMECCGLEYDYINVQLGKEFSYEIENLVVHLFCKDAFKYMDFNEYDRIYTYNPINDYGGNKEFASFYKHIWEQLKKGTIWFEYGSIPKIFKKEGKPLDKINKYDNSHFWIKQ